MNKTLAEINKKRREEREKKKEEAYKFYRNFISKHFKRPTYKDIAEYLNCTEENARKVVDGLKKDGKLVEVKFRKDQDIDLPHEWIECTKR